MIRPPSALLLLATTLATGSGPGVTGPAPDMSGAGARASPPVDRVLPRQEPAIVEGTVTLRGGAVDAPPPRSPYARRRYRPPARSTSGNGDVRNVAVFVLVDGSGPSLSDTTVQVVQRDRTIIPHVTVIRVGTTVEFPNRDDVFHNLFSLSGPHAFNLGRYPPGESPSVVFDDPGVVRMFCDIHSDMTGVIRVVETPHITRPDDDGTYRIPGVPAGRHRVVAWHEVAGADTVEVTVPSSGSVRADLTLGG